MSTTIEKAKGGRINIGLDPNAEFLIGDVARFTGYTNRHLLRLDGNGIPASHRDENGHRVWFVKDLVEIRAHRNKTIKKRL